MFKTITLYLLSLIFCSLSSVIGDRPLIKTNLGLVEGLYKQSYNGREYAAFEGIPYAKPPVNELRFREPISAEPWVGVLNATTTYTCMQKSILLGNTLSGEEDCLYLNVYVPKRNIKTTDNLDVVVHIHGGSFIVGNPTTMSGPSYLMDKDVVYVNMNYRLGILGFLSTEDEVVPGNYGMKDQVMALKWIQQHIKQFGGNPNSVTITGVSAGAGSVHLLYFSKLSKGLFHRGFSQSGTALSPWAIQYAPLKQARKIGALVGCDYTCTKKYVKCMRQRSAKQLVEYTEHLQSQIPILPIANFAPVVEKPSKHAFLVDYPYNLLKNKDFNDVPWITGMTSEEGVTGMMLILPQLQQFDEQWNDLARYYLDFNDTVCDSDKIMVAEKIRKHYFGDKKLSQETAHTIVKLFGHRYWDTSVERSARMQAAVSKHKVLAYIYGYKSSFRSNFAKDLGVEEDYGVNHAEDAGLIYEMNFMYYSPETMKFDENDVKIKDMFINMIASFASNTLTKFGNVDWNPVTNDADFSYLSILKPGEIKMKTVDELTPTSFWNSLPIMENEKATTNLCAGKTQKNEL